jgi:hypothetical protein
MSKVFDLKKNMQPYASVKAEVSVAEGLTTLRESGKEFLLITVTANDPPGEQPASVLREDKLIELAKNQGQKLSELLETLPPLLELEGDALPYEDLSELLTVLGMTRAAAFVVRSAGGPVGVVPRSAVARALPPEEIAFVGSERGEMRTSARTYICRKCKPARRKRPMTGGAPTCDVWSHGTMQQE